MPSHSPNVMQTVEATVTSKGQITLPSALRRRLGLQTGSRVRFSMPDGGPIEVEPVRCELEDLWLLAGSGTKQKRRMSQEEMNAAKASRIW